jgi:hypothetical protein
MEDYEKIEVLLEAIEGAANMMRGMQHDSAIPCGAKNALAVKMAELDKLVDEYA